jgi:hypothetical protein
MHVHRYRAILTSWHVKRAHQAYQDFATINKTASITKTKRTILKYDEPHEASYLAAGRSRFNNFLLADFVFTMFIPFDVSQRCIRHRLRLGYRWILRFPCVLIHILPWKKGALYRFHLGKLFLEKAKTRSLKKGIFRREKRKMEHWNHTPFESPCNFTSKAIFTGKFRIFASFRATKRSKLGNFFWGWWSTF